MAAVGGTVDALAVQVAIGLKREAVRWGVGDALSNLTVGVHVDRLVAGVKYVILGLRRVLLGCILPAVGVLQLEGGKTCKLAYAESYTVMLAQVHV